LVLAHLRLQGSDLITEAFDENRVGISINHWLILNISSPRSILNRGEGLLVVGLGRRDASNHCRARVATQTILQYTSQFRVTIWDE